MTNQDDPGPGVVREMAANVTMMAIEGEPRSLGDLAASMAALRTDQLTKLSPRIRDALEGRTVDPEILSAYALGAMFACEMVALEACRLKGGLPTSDATAAFVSNAERIVRERGKPSGSGLRYEDDRVVIETGRGGYDLIVTRRNTAETSTGFRDYDNPTTLVKDGRVVRHHGEAGMIAGHLAGLAITGLEP